MHCCCVLHKLMASTMGPLPRSPDHKWNSDRLNCVPGTSSSSCSSTGGTTANSGSEHSIGEKFFPVSNNQGGNVRKKIFLSLLFYFQAELQMYGFNSNLFRNLSDASRHPHGSAAVSVMIQVAERQATANKAIKAITQHLKKVQRAMALNFHVCHLLRRGIYERRDFCRTPYRIACMLSLYR